MTLKLYRDDPYLLRFEARVVEQREHQGRPAVVLDRTAFYAESGGQPWDLGTLAGVPLTGVIEDGASVLHLLERPLAAVAGATVEGLVDAERRRDHRQQHHGQHLLSRAFVECCGLRTVAFHLGSAATTIDLERAAGADEIERAARRANEVVWEARPVETRSVDRAEAQRLGCALPPGGDQDVRIVEAAGFDLQPCSGTHPRNTAEVGVIVPIQAERYKGATRLHFVCGHRALALVETRLATLGRVGAALSAPADQLADRARQVLGELEQARKRAEDLLGRVLAAEARELLAQAGRPSAGVPVVVAAVFDDRPPTELRALALELTRVAPCVALLGARGASAQVVFARTPGLPVDLAALLRESLELLGGRGGGKGDVVQGGGPQAERLDQAIDLARRRAAAE